jgi:hypothetical protein
VWSDPLLPNFAGVFERRVFHARDHRRAAASARTRDESRTERRVSPHARDPKGEIHSAVGNWFEPDNIGSLWQIGRGKRHSSALAPVDDDGTVCWLLVIIAAPLAAMPLDLRSYSASNTRLPHDSTIDQFFTDDQWESYRQLGEWAATAVIRRPAAPVQWNSQ